MRAEHVVPWNNDQTAVYQRYMQSPPAVDYPYGLEGDSFKRLAGQGWLNDEVVNAYIHLLNRAAQVRAASPSKTSRPYRSYIFDTFCYPSICHGKTLEQILKAGKVRLLVIIS